MNRKRARPSRSWTLISIAIVVAVVASMVISALIPNVRGGSATRSNNSDRMQQTVSP